MSAFEICECSSRLNVVYPRQYIKKCCSPSMQFFLHTKHVRSSTGINAPLFSYFQYIFIYWVTDSLTDWLTDWVTDWLTDSLTHSLADWLGGWLASWLSDWLTAWVTERVAGWLANWLNDWLTEWVSRVAGWIVWLTDWPIEQLMSEEWLD